MIAGARLSAAIDIYSVIEGQRRPAADALKDWGAAHRFAGSNDRAAIAGLVYDALRVKSSAAWLMGEDAPRAVLLGMLRRFRGLDVEAIALMASGEGHAAAPLSGAERDRLTAADVEGAPDHVRGDFPEWLSRSWHNAFGDAAVDEGRALATRAPLDLRVNTLKGTAEKALRALSHLSARQTPWAATGLRIEPGEGGRAPPVTAEPAYLKGQVEIQDEGSQVAAALSGAGPGEQVLDLCAGGGGKALALAALMNNKGQVYATDGDLRRLAPIHDRIARADARNIQVRTPRHGQDVVADLEKRCDMVLVDAPCTGTGTWRRHPDAKWRIRPSAVAERQKTQDLVLGAAARFVKPGGRLVYVTCSVLPEENEDRIAAFLDINPDFVPHSVENLANAAGLPDLPAKAATRGPGLQMTPHRTATDGFYVAVLRRSPS